MTPLVSSERVGTIMIVTLAALAGLAAVAMIALGPAVQMTVLVLWAIALLAALRFPYAMTTTALTAGVLLPNYLTIRLPFTTPLNGSVVIASVLAVAAFAVLVGERQSGLPVALAGVALGVAFVWVAGPWVAASGGWASRTVAALASSGSIAAAVLGAAVVAGSERGRVALARGFAFGGALAAGYGLVEMITRRNILLDLGVVGEPQLAKYYDVPVRLGITRISGAFTHPTMLSIFLGLSILCTIGLWRLRKLSTPAMGALVALIGIAQLATVTRASVGAVIVVVAIWMLIAGSLPVRWKLVSIGGIVAVVFGVSVVLPQLGAIRTLLDPNARTEAGGSIQYRIALTRSLLQEFRHAPLLGNPIDEQQSFLAGFRSLDSEIAALLRTRGFLGLAAFGALALAPLLALRRRSESAMFGAAIAVFVIGVSLTVALFGALTIYVFVALVLALALTLSDREDRGRAL